MPPLVKTQTLSTMYLNYGIMKILEIVHLGKVKISTGNFGKLKVYNQYFDVYSSIKWVQSIAIYEYYDSLNI